MPSRIKKHFLPLLLIVIGLIVCALNYTPGTILSGWDTLHPEFNFLLNFQRVFFGVFRPEQGLGAVAAHSHMSDIPRILILVILDLILPTSFLRYGYIFLTLVVGPLGVFYFLKHVFGKENKYKYIEGTAFLGGLFYMLNLGTLQQFNVPFEMFNALYAFLPWILLYALKYIHSAHTEHKKYLLFFAIFTLLGAPMAYAPALWYMHFFLLSLFLGIISFPGLLKKDFKLIKKSAILILVTLLINSFWLLPHIYFLLTHGGDVQNALVNKLFSDQAFLYNKEFGNIKNLALLKSFLFTWNVYLGHGEFGYLLSPWIEYLKQTPVLFTGYLLAFIALLGVVFAILKRNAILLAILAVSIFTLFFLFNDNPPFGALFTFIQNKIPLFKEAFRFPHTKLFIHFIFVFSIFFACGILWLVNFLNDKLGKFAAKAPLAIVTILIFFFMLPAFKGNYLSPEMRIKIPSDYKELSSYLNNQTDMGKVALLPINSFWGWDYYNWGYQGSGFVWFDIKQPVLARDFDRWTSYNEQYYREMSYAVYSQDPVKLQNVIQKYGISYLIFDKSIIAPENDPKILFREQTINLLKKQNILAKKQDFGELELYQIKNPKGQIFTMNPVNVEPSTKVLDEDAAYSISGEYITTQNKTASDFPLRDLINNEGELNPTLYKMTNDGIEFSTGGQTAMPESATLQNSVISDVFASSDQENINLTLSPKQIGSNSYAGKLDIPFQKIENPIFNINGADSFVVPLDLTNDHSVNLGRIALKTNSNNFIAVYNSESSKIETLPLSYDKMSLTPCSGKSNINDFGINFNSPNSFSLFAKGTPLCLTLPFSKIFDDKANLPNVMLFGVNYDLKVSNPNAPTYICIENLENGNCLSYSSVNLTKEGTSQNSFTYGIQKSDLNKIGLRFYLDTTKNETPTHVRFDDLSISVTEPEQSVIIPGQTISKLAPLNQDLSNLFVYFSGDQRLSQDLSKLPKTSGSCNSNPLVKNPNKTEFIKKTSSYTRYLTTEGSLCDTFSYQNLVQNQGYIVFITSRNLKGLPLNVCVTNFYSKRCDVYTRLDYNKDFKTQAFLLPPMGNVSSGYDVNINNLAIKGTPSENDLKSIVFMPFQYSLASNLTTGTTGRINETKSLPYHQINPDLYQASLPDKGQVLALDYSYEAGWKAYAFKDTGKFGHILDEIAPFLRGHELKDKVLVDNWANGWVNDQDGEFVLIVYLPQYLEYLGIILTLGTLIFLIIASLRHREGDGEILEGGQEKRQSEHEDLADAGFASPEKILSATEQPSQVDENQNL